MHRFGIILLLVLVFILNSNQTFAVTRLSLDKLKKNGVRVIPCPKYVGHRKSGVHNELQKPNIACIAGGDPRAASKDIKLNRYVLPGGYRIGTAFTPIEDQQGDCQTEPFEVINFPAIINYEVHEANFKTGFFITVYNAGTGRVEDRVFRARGEAYGSFAWNFPGRYYLRMTATDDPREELQPYFSVSMEFMPPYEGWNITKADMRYAGVKKVKCPPMVLDMQTARLFKLGRKFLCMNKGSPLEAGFTDAPFNTGSAIFMASELGDGAEGDTITLPFRVRKPRALTYSVSDPTPGKGRTQIYMYDLATGRNVYNIVSVKGSIDSTTTMMNIPGDYFFLIRTTPSNPEEFGEIGWDIEVAAEEDETWAAAKAP